MTKRILGCLALCAAALSAQNAPPPAIDIQPRYQAVDVFTASGTSERLTVQLAANATKSVLFDSAVVYTSAAASFKVYQNGTAATGTALVPNALNNSPTPVATAYASSNAGNGSWAHPPQFFTAVAQAFLYGLEKFFMGAPHGNTENLSIEVQPFTGTGVIIITWVER